MTNADTLLVMPEYVTLRIEPQAREDIRAANHQLMGLISGPVTLTETLSALSRVARMHPQDFLAALNAVRER